MQSVFQWLQKLETFADQAVCCMTLLCFDNFFEVKTVIKVLGWVLFGYNCTVLLNRW